MPLFIGVLILGNRKHRADLQGATDTGFADLSNRFMADVLQDFKGLAVLGILIVDRVDPFNQGRPLALHTGLTSVRTASDDPLPFVVLNAICHD